LVARRL